MYSFRYYIFVFLLYISVLLFGNSINAQELHWSGYRSEAPLSAELTGINNLTDGTKKFFLLKTGMLVEAEISSSENSVKLKSQYGTIQVLKENIEFAGETKEEIYHYKKSQVAPNSCTQELNFAEWCLNNGFYSESLSEFQTALLSAPNDNLKNYINQRLKQVQSQNNTASGDNTRKNTDTAAEESGDSFDQWVNGVPKSVFDTFSKKVQPILVQRCASAVCHGSNSPQKFKISIPRQPGGKTTQGNLRATVQFINPDNPCSSPILSALVTQHGGKRALFSVESEQYNNIIDWFQLTAKELPPEWQNETASQNAVNQKTANQNTVKPAVPQSALQTEIVKPDTLPKQFQESLEAMTKTGLKVPAAHTAPKTAANIPAAVPIDENKPEEEADPFDPLRFNAKYHSKIIEAKLKKLVPDTVIR